MASPPAGSPPAPSGSQNGSPPPPTPEADGDDKSSPPPPPTSSPPPPPAPPKSSPPPPPSSPPPPPTLSPPPPPNSPPPPNKDSPSPPSPSKGDSSDSSTSPPQEDSATSSPPPPPPPAENSDNPASPSPPTSPPPPGASLTPPSKTPSPPNTPPTFGPPTVNGSNPPGSYLSPPHSVPHTPPSSPTHPTTGSTPHSSSSHPPANSSSSNVNVGVVAGMSVAGIVVVAAFVVVFFACSRKKRRQSYYLDPACRPKDQYYNGTSQWQSPQEHIVKLHSPQGVTGTLVGGTGGWGAPAAPTQPFPTNHISGEYSSGLSGQNYSPMPPQSPLGGFSKSQFNYEELAAATARFSQANLIGQGGFGFVHKGVLPDGKVVAVKSLKSGSGQGEREFQAEVEIISRIHHKHLVSLVGYCITEGQRMLVYEYVPNNTLEFHLHGKGQPVMDWATRLRIALGSAKGLAYLHEDCHPRIIHRDIKAANILIDNNFEAMVADFGLAKLTSDNYTHVSTRVMGTFGYLAPEYASSGKLTEKSDVFSFGVMLLELITGRRPVDTTDKMMEDSLVDWARPLLSKAIEDGNYDSLADRRMEGNYMPNEMARIVSCAAASIRHSARRRPKMSQIVRSLEGDSSVLEDPNEGVKPGQNSGSSQGNSSSIYDTGAYNADMMKFRKMVMSSQELGSSEYGGTGEYGSNASTTSGIENSKEMGNSGSKGRNYRAV